MATKISVNNQNGTINYEGADLSIAYDLSGEASGTPTSDSTVFSFKAVRVFRLAASGHVAHCITAPSTTTTFTIKKEVSGVETSIGTIVYSLGTKVGSVTITGGVEVSFAVGDIIKIVAPTALNSIDTPFYTLYCTAP